VPQLASRVYGDLAVTMGVVSIDFQVCLPQESIQLSSVQRVAGTGTNGIPPALNIQGVDFTAIEEVQMNGVVSPDFIVVSSTQLIAQVPDSLARATITSVTVLSRRLTITPRSLLRFRVAPSAGRVQGILRLVQLYMKVLFTTPGRDIFSPNIGGGLLRTLGATFGADQTSDVAANLVIAVSQTNRQIVAIQSRDQRIPRDERLLTARVVSTNFDRAQAALLGTIDIQSQAGRSAITNLEL
jgi:hypothetical protein